MKKPIVCTPKSLPANATLRAGARAFRENPANRPSLEGLLRLAPAFKPDKFSLAASRTRYWGSGGVALTVSFLDGPAPELRVRILGHMNAWNQTANVSFVETHGDAHVRIARTPGDGYWSYLGTDILEIASDEPTMNLDSFTMQTDDMEFHRVIRHEAGHTLGFVHEHVRRELVERIDREKAIAYFGATQGWSEAEVMAQVLTPLEESSLLGTATSDARSIMCYQLPGDITVDGEPIIGGVDIDPDDFVMAAKLYPTLKQKASEARPTNGHCPIVFLTNDDPEFVAAVIAATQRG